MHKFHRTFAFKIHAKANRLIFKSITVILFISILSWNLHAWTMVWSGNNHSQLEGEILIDLRKEHKSTNVTAVNRSAFPCFRCHNSRFSIDKYARKWVFPFVINKRIWEVFRVKGLDAHSEGSSGIKFKHSGIAVVVSSNPDSDDYIMFKRTALEICV